jgi:anti-sigma factor ChrR (cupin superfamily)
VNRIDLNPEEGKPTMKRTILVSLIASAAVSAAALADNAAPALHVTQAQMKWVSPYGPKGPQFSFVEGQFGDKHPASMLIKFAAGGDSGWHLHDEDYRAVVIKGTFTEQQLGETAETKLPVGSFFTQPGKVAHRNGCLKGADCLLYVRFDHGASSTPTTADGKIVQVPPAKK